MHVDTSCLWPVDLARFLVPLGTTTLFVDSTNVAPTGGAGAIRALRDAFRGLPLRCFMQAPSYCPLDPSLETSAWDMVAADVAALLGDGCVSIGETVWSKIALEHADYVKTVQTCRATNKRVSGHGGEIRRGDEPAYDGYVAAGLQDDHCVGKPEDILPRLRRGLKLFLVECSGRRGQLQPLLKRMMESGLSFRQACLCIDNITVMDMVKAGYGYQDNLIRIALANGVSPVEAFRMATLNPAEHYRVANTVGSIAPGRKADILLMESPSSFPPEKVLVGGKIAAERGVFVAAIPEPDFPPLYRRSVQTAKIDRRGIAARAQGPDRALRSRVIEVVDGDAFNGEKIVALDLVSGIIEPRPQDDILRIVVAERYGRSGDIGSAFVKGFGLKRGALAVSIIIPSNNIAAVGADDDDIWTAIQHLGAIQGGLVVVDGGKVVAEVPLPVGGILSTEPFEALVARIELAHQAAQALGCVLQHPFFTIAQTVLSTLPDLGLTDRGLVNSRTGQVVSVTEEKAA
jgi:adenine deaminase